MLAPISDENDGTKGFYDGGLLNLILCNSLIRSEVIRIAKESVQAVNIYSSMPNTKLRMYLNGNGCLNSRNRSMIFFTQCTAKNICNLHFRSFKIGAIDL